MEVLPGIGKADVHDGGFMAEGAVAAVHSLLSRCSIVWIWRRGGKGEVDDEAGGFAIARAGVGSAGGCFGHGQVDKASR